jgi:hypothetical protein
MLFARRHCAAGEFRIGEQHRHIARIELQLELDLLRRVHSDFPLTYLSRLNVKLRANPPQAFERPA